MTRARPREASHRSARRSGSRRSRLCPVTDAAVANFAAAAAAEYRVYLCPAGNLAGILEWGGVCVLFLCGRGGQARSGAASATPESAHRETADPPLMDDNTRQNAEHAPGKFYYRDKVWLDFITNH